MFGSKKYDTIVGTATAVGEGGIAIIRLSGQSSVGILTRFFHSSGAGFQKFDSHRFYFGKFLRPDGSVVDEIMAVAMLAPASYTREDVCEIHCHGNRFIVQEIIDCLTDAGARLAFPGEFTYRAFINGRIDLSQAEAVIDVIQAKSLAAEHIAIKQLTGKLSKTIHRYRDLVFELLVLVEAYIDFPDDEIEAVHFDKLKNQTISIIDEISELIKNFDSGRMIKDGISVLILGRPNVGKSSLLNSLLGESRAIVTHIPGTTRDVIEEQIVLNGLPIRLIDTAGIRDTKDPIEAEGVNRAQKKIQAADIVLFVIDGSLPLVEDDFVALDLIREKKTIVVINKNDLGNVPIDQQFLEIPHCYISAKNESGIEELKHTLFQSLNICTDLEVREDILVSDRRHREALMHCKGKMANFLVGLDNHLFPDLLAIDLREALQALGQITGETTPDDILNNIFGRFCVGK